KDQVKGIELGADDYIVKPFNKDILIAKIKTLLKHREIATSVNPLTKLPGNTVIEQEIKKRLNNNQHFVFFYIDLANFKAYNDYYGFHKGDEVIKFVADILVKVTGKYSPNSSFVGHIGGDDFVVILDDVEKYKLLADQIIQTFDEKIINFYQAKDVEQGYILVQNRQGQLQRFPIMTISVTSISTKFTSINHYGELINKAAELKKYAKGFNRSILAEERRAT
ncbi:MAG: diguanylate cyclase, partial [Endomicrobia bacterium]|nr:diguanylate cyclase [Endomicrobiia bacterium]